MGHLQATVTTGAAAGLVVLVYLGFVVLGLVAMGKIISKAGYSPWFVLLGLIPFVNLVMFLVFAFSDWPAQQELRRWRQGYGASPAPYGGGSGPYGGPPGPYGGQPTSYGGQPTPPAGQPTPYGNPSGQPGPYGNQRGSYGDPSGTYGNPPAGQPTPSGNPAGPPDPSGNPSGTFIGPAGKYGAANPPPPSNWQPREGES